ncbi:MAG: thioredoxin [Clostridia bacterium]|nr:thioredoxin [Clostridia bacterium]
MSVKVITAKNFESEVLAETKTVLIDFWATWCGPCQMLAPIVEEIAQERADIKVGKVNVDEEPELASAFSIVSIPTLAVIKNKQVVDFIVGYRTKEEILSHLA